MLHPDFSLEEEPYPAPQQVVRMGLAHPAKEGRFSSFANPALVMAAKGGHLDALKLLRRHGANLDATDQYDRTALMVAASSGSYDACRELIRCGASASAVDAQGLNPLLHACWGRSPGCVKELLESAGADPDEADLFDETPAMVAARVGNVESLKLLMSHGCDLTLRDENDWDALGKAKARGGRVEIIDAIEGALRVVANTTGASGDDDAYDPDELD